MIFLQLDHEVLGSNQGTFIALGPKSNGTSKASKLMSLKEQISLVHKEGGSVFE